MVRIWQLSFVLLSGAIVFGSIVRAAEDSPVVTAARDGDLTAVRDLVELGEDVNAPTADGSSPLLFAAYHFDIDMAEALIAAGAIVDVPNNYGVTPLLQASRTGDAGMVEVLLDAGADPSLAHPEGETPLMAASRSGSLPAVSLLLASGADPNRADTFQDQTALMWAAAEGHLEVVGLLLDAGADPDHQARVTSITERQNADHPTGGFTALMWAARNGENRVVRRLAEAGADLDLANGDGATATMIAMYNDRFDLAAMLIEMGSDVNDGSLYTAVEMRASTTDQFAFDGSQLRPDHENELTALDLVALLLERGADPHQWFQGQFHSTSMPNGDRFANTPFFRAAVASDVEALKLFLDYVTDLDQVLVVPTPDEPEAEEPPAGGRGRANPNAGRTAAMVAMRGGRGPGMTGGPGYIRSGEVPYREPGSRSPEDALLVLLDAGADPNAKAPDGSTLLHIAGQVGNLDVIRALADAGVDFDEPNDDGLTALDIAEGKQPEGAEAEEAELPPPGGRGGRGGGESPEVAGLLRELMGLPPAPVPPESPDSEVAEAEEDAQ